MSLLCMFSIQYCWTINRPVNWKLFTIISGDSLHCQSYRYRYCSSNSFCDSICDRWMRHGHFTTRTHFQQTVVNEHCYSLWWVGWGEGRSGHMQWQQITQSSISRLLRTDRQWQLWRMPRQSSPAMAIVCRHGRMIIVVFQRQGIRCDIKRWEEGQLSYHEHTG